MEATLERDRWRGLDEVRERLGVVLAGDCRDHAELEDVLQETLLRAARYRLRLREPASLFGWCVRIARNVLADQRRRQRRWTPLVLTDEEEGDGRVAEPAAPEPPREESWRLGHYEVDREDAERLLARAVEGLPPDERTLLATFYGGGRSTAETARRCAIPRRAVKIRLFRVRQRLARTLRHRLALMHGGEGSGTRRVAANGGGTR